MDPQSNQPPTYSSTSPETPLQPQSAPPSGHRVLKGALLISSGFVALAGLALVNLLVGVLGLPDGIVMVVRMLSFVLGCGAVVMLFLGPILGIMVLTKK